MEDEVEYAKRRSQRNRKRCIIGFSILLVILLIVAIIVVVTLVIVPLLRDKKEAGQFRLPSSVVPDKYSLEIQPYLDSGNFTFDGSVNITITCHSSTNSITLHSSALNIHQVTVEEVTRGSNLKIKDTQTVSKYELFIINLKNDLRAGRMYVLHLKFNGTMGRSKGFYWRSYKKDSVEEYIAATNFKPTYARRAFPCFDEPAYKATFDITIIRQKSYLSVSCSKNRRNFLREDDWVADVYEPSIKISTHSVSFVIRNNQLPHIAQSNVTVAARKESMSKPQDALDAAQNAYDFYRLKLTPPFYPAEIDIVVVPDDVDSKKPVMFDALGQDSSSWGLITLDESSMLSSRQAEEWEKQEVAMNIAHQVASQLFGSLVTPKWWSDLWVTEAVCTYLSIQAADDRINPKWKSLETLKRSGDYIQFDCSEESLPLSMAVDEPEDISKPFNYALYRKGARLINMAHGLLKDKLFWHGLSKFLLDREFNVTGYGDLWKHLTESQGNGKDKINFEEVMKPWIHNRGHPIVTLNRNYIQKTGFLSQSSCLNESTIWNIPITYLESEKNSKDKDIIWLKSANRTLYAMPGKTHWVLLNGELNGYFHVNYDMENWKLLADQLKDDFTIIPTSSRYQLLYDALFLARMNITSYVVLLEMLPYMKHEPNIHMKEFLANVELSEMWKMLRMSKVDSNWKVITIEYKTDPAEFHYGRFFKLVSLAFEDFVLTVIGETYRSLFRDDSEDQDLLPRIDLKREIATLSCYYDRLPCMEDAKKQSVAWLKEKEPFKQIKMLDRRLIRPYLCTAVRKNPSMGDKIYEFFKHKNEAHEYLMNSGEAQDMVYALGCSDGSHRISVYMERFIIDEGDPATFIESMLNTHNGSFNLFDYLSSNINKLKNNYDRLELVVKRFSEAVANPKEFEKMTEILEKFKDEIKKDNGKIESNKINKMFERYIEKAKRRLEFVKYQLPPMVHWLRQYNSRG